MGEGHGSFPRLLAFLSLKAPLKSRLPRRGAASLSLCQRDQCRFAAIKWLLPAQLFAGGG